MSPDFSRSTEAAVEVSSCRETNYIFNCDGIAIPIAGPEEMKEFYRGVGLVAKMALVLAVLVCMFLLR
ncbi:hypothetical protein [Variovorax saccharolyticus]|uniref:hypothetical protein n=1 Tax=Variovorax saccharolyticus TaxID=3053516 RepID=UPI0025750767|nr:hypothetical protein [Variovorax sp. J22R187]MDM0021859.1 hypothetical protein [Variovorax sp. J22R187]